MIDVGTCITYDFINNSNEYLGGGISPGFNLRMKALSSFTENLPRVNFKIKSTPLIGTNTKESIESGVSMELLMKSFKIFLHMNNYTLK